MTKDQNLYFYEDSDSCNPPEILDYVKFAQHDPHFQALDEDDQISYVRLLIEAEEWAKDMGFSRTYIDSLREGGIR
jgi:hypothetical protein